MIISVQDFKMPPLGIVPFSVYGTNHAQKCEILTSRILTAPLTPTDLFFNILPICTLSAFLSHHFLFMKGTFLQVSSFIKPPILSSQMSFPLLASLGKVPSDSLPVCTTLTKQTPALPVQFFPPQRTFISLWLHWALPLPAGACWVPINNLGIPLLHACLHSAGWSGSCFNTYYT